MVIIPRGHRQLCESRGGGTASVVPARHRQLCESTSHGTLASRPAAAMPLSSRVASVTSPHPAPARSEPALNDRRGR